MPLPDLWLWQRQNVLDTWERYPKRALFASTRIGKTFTDIALDLVWRKHKGVHKSLVTSLLTACPQWHGWLEDAGLTVYPAYRMSSDRIRAALKTKEWNDGVLLINDDKLPRVVEELIRWEADALHVDESHRFRGVSTKRGRAMRRLAWRAHFVRLLSGTPTPNHYGDLWGQMVALSREDWGASYSSFIQRFLVVDAMFPGRVLAHKNVDELQALLLRWADIVRREDIFGPDHWQEIERTVEMPESCWRLYHKLAREWILDEPELETANVLVRMLRLQQIACGFLPDSSRAGEEVELHTATIDACMADLCEVIACDEKAVVYHRFTREGTVLRDRLDALYNHNGRFAEVDVVEINGSIPVQKRQDAIERFARPGRPAVAVVQVQSGGTGISFAEANHVMFLSEMFNLDDDLQARDRAYKQVGGKAIPRTITRYRVAGTVHDYIAEVKDSKMTVHEALRNADRTALVYGTIRRRKKAA